MTVLVRALILAFFFFLFRLFFPPALIGGFTTHTPDLSTLAFSGCGPAFSIDDIANAPSPPLQQLEIATCNWLPALPAMLRCCDWIVPHL